jgi:hypothetical protein
MKIDVSILTMPPVLSPLPEMEMEYASVKQPMMNLGYFNLNPFTDFFWPTHPSSAGVIACAVVP